MPSCSKQGNFNSIKVQLKPYVALYAADVPEFQFHKGTIKTLVERRQLEIKAHFNSINVQLKLPMYGYNSVSLPFQFHKGTIKTAPVSPKVCACLISIP